MDPQNKDKRGQVGETGEVQAAGAGVPDQGNKIWRRGKRGI